MKDFDIIIQNGFIVDGTGDQGFAGEIAIKGNSIALIAAKIEGTAEKIIDAKGCMVSPGFIDPHVHEETVILNDSEFEVFIRQGVTSTINGNCGHSVTPLDSKNIYEYYYLNGLLSEEAQKNMKKNNQTGMTFPNIVILCVKRVQILIWDFSWDMVQFAGQ